MLYILLILAIVLHIWQYKDVAIKMIFHILTEHFIGCVWSKHTMISRLPATAFIKSQKVFSTRFIEQSEHSARNVLVQQYKGYFVQTCTPWWMNPDIGHPDNLFQTNPFIRTFTSPPSLNIAHPPHLTNNEQNIVVISQKKVIRTHLLFALLSSRNRILLKIQQQLQQVRKIRIPKKGKQC